MSPSQFGDAFSTEKTAEEVQKMWTGLGVLRLGGLCFSR